nr:hypothetical protein [Ferrimicrobium acidiphilum]
MELISIKTAPKEFRVRLLQALGYDVDPEGIYATKDGKPVVDKYINKAVRVENMAIMPGSTIVIDDNPISIASYFEEHEETS